VSQPANAPPLAGVRVVDLSRVLAGPYATMTLADLGADVVKIEHPAGGDETRAWGPPFAGGESAYFLSVNRGKRSVAVDLKDPEGRDLALELCARADVVIENFRPGGAARLGLDYEAVRARRPDVVYCTISGFGSREPSDRAGYDFTVQAESGLMAITGEPDGEPVKVGVAIVDVLTGLNAATAILAALHRRDVTGEGDRVEVSLLDTAFAALVNVGANALLTGEEPRRYGNAHPSIVPYQPFRAADGWIAVAAANDGLYSKLCLGGSAARLGRACGKHPGSRRGAACGAGQDSAGGSPDGRRRRAGRSSLRARECAARRIGATSAARAAHGRGTRGARRR